jgi:hypothetical protein
MEVASSRMAGFGQRGRLVRTEDGASAQNGILGLWNYEAMETERRAGESEVLGCFLLGPGAEVAPGFALYDDKTSVPRRLATTASAVDGLLLLRQA